MGPKRASVTTLDDERRARTRSVKAFRRSITEAVLSKFQIPRPLVTLTEMEVTVAPESTVTQTDLIPLYKMTADRPLHHSNGVSTPDTEDNFYSVLLSQQKDSGEAIFRRVTVPTPGDFFTVTSPSSRKLSDDTSLVTVKQTPSAFSEIDDVDEFHELSMEAPAPLLVTSRFRQRKFGISMRGISKEFELPPPIDSDPLFETKRPPPVKPTGHWVKDGINGTDALMSRDRGNWRVAGYWKQRDPHPDTGLHYPMPVANASEWKGQSEFCQKLRQIQNSGHLECGSYCGPSHHRLPGGQFTSNDHANHEFKDHLSKIFWPAALLRDYIEKFNVKPPDEFVDYVMSYKLDHPVPFKPIPEEKQTTETSASRPLTASELVYLKCLDDFATSILKTEVENFDVKFKAWREASSAAIKRMAEAEKLSIQTHTGIPQSSNAATATATMTTTAAAAGTSVSK
jgi:hypothetical protein